ncbi:hypothetical protein EGR_09009 [Echinococcus granulosus]|uniref:Uncharacterized protein n=1 Tax=Echinococcus granulosus TaxID=6210 RepID=W6UCV6_ECHGR|nr:hypothetical protein EGR_09009 [Echinococcus granulosus]EUB56117.1 hypothetical protein EGR_09009 [Echinococcus granulosus]
METQPCPLLRSLLSTLEFDFTDPTHRHLCLFLHLPHFDSPGAPLAASLTGGLVHHLQKPATRSFHKLLCYRRCGGSTTGWGRRHGPLHSYHCRRLEGGNVQHNVGIDNALRLEQLATIPPRWLHTRHRLEVHFFHNGHLRVEVLPTGHTAQGTSTDCHSGLKSIMATSERAATVPRRVVARVSAALVTASTRTVYSRSEFPVSWPILPGSRVYSVVNRTPEQVNWMVYTVLASTGVQSGQSQCKELQYSAPPLPEGKSPAAKPCQSANLLATETILDCNIIDSSWQVICIWGLWWLSRVSTAS